MQGRMTSQPRTLFLAAVLVPLLMMTSALDLTDDVSLEFDVKTIEECKEYPDLPHSYRDMRIEMDPDTDSLYISGTLNATEPLQPGTKGTVKILRCLDKTEQSCEKYVDFDVEDFCQHLPEKGESWSTIVENLKNFDPHCPVAAGVYELYEAPLSMKNKGQIAMMGHWLLQVTVSYQDRIITCLRGDVDIRSKRGWERRK